MTRKDSVHTCRRDSGCVLAVPTGAQVGQGILDLNAVPEATLATMPGDDAGHRQGVRRTPAVRHHRRGQHVSARAEAHAGAAHRPLREGVRPLEPERGDARRRSCSCPASRSG